MGGGCIHACRCMDSGASKGIVCASFLPSSPLSSGVLLNGSTARRWVGTKGASQGLAVDDKANVPPRQREPAGVREFVLGLYQNVVPATPGVLQ